MLFSGHAKSSDSPKTLDFPTILEPFYDGKTGCLTKIGNVSQQRIGLIQEYRRSKALLLENVFHT